MATKLMQLFQDMLAHLFAPAEDPRQAYASAEQRQQEMLAKVRQARADVVNAKVRLQAKLQAVKGEVAQLQAQAIEALRNNQEPLARLALQRQQMVLARQNVLEQQSQVVQREEAQLILTEQHLITQMEAYTTQRAISQTRYGAAEAQVRYKEAMTGVSQELTDLGQVLKAADEKTETIQARVSALDELIDDGILSLPGIPGSGHRSLDTLAMNNAVEEQLATLKRQMESKGMTRSD